MDDRLREELETLYSSEVPLLSELLSEQTLFNVGISLVGPQAIDPSPARLSGQEVCRKRGAEAESSSNVRARAQDVAMLPPPPSEGHSLPPNSQILSARAIPGGQRFRSRGTPGSERSSSSSSGSARMAPGSGTGKLVLRLPAPPDADLSKEDKTVETAGVSGTAPASALCVLLPPEIRTFVSAIPDRLFLARSSHSQDLS